MVKQEWQQQSFLAPVHVDAGQKLPGRRWRKKRNPNPDVAQALAFRRQARAVIYESNTPAALPRLTTHQQKIYRAIEYGEEKKLAEWKDQYEAEKWGLTGEIFYLDQVVELETNSGCGDCSSNWIRQAVVQTPGRGKRAGQTQLLVNDHCSCAAIDRTLKVWVPNNQIVKRE